MMSRAATMSRTIDEAVAKLGPGPLSEESVQQHIAPLFSRVLASDRVYLANHSLGRPLDAMAEDVGEATSLWEQSLMTHGMLAVCKVICQLEPSFSFQASEARPNDLKRA